MELNQKSNLNLHTYGHLNLVNKPEIPNGKKTASILTNDVSQN